MLEKIALVIVGVLVSGLGYWIKRFVERKADTEALDRHKKLLEINKQMTEQQVTVEDLNRSFEGFWSKKPITQNNTAY